MIIEWVKDFCKYLQVPMCGDIARQCNKEFWENYEGLNMEKKVVKRRISKCYILEEDIPFEASPIKICRTRKLAEHYKRILSPKWEEAFGYGLRVQETKFYEDDTEETEVYNVYEPE